MDFLLCQEQSKGVVYPTGGGTGASSSRTLIWLDVRRGAWTLMLNRGCCRQHMCLSPSRGAWEQMKQFSHLSSQLEQGEVQACCFPSPRTGIEGQGGKVPYTRGSHTVSTTSRGRFFGRVLWVGSYLCQRRCLMLAVVSILILGCQCNRLSMFL